MSLTTSFLGTMSLPTMPLATIVPLDNSSLRQLFLCSFTNGYCKEDGPPDDQHFFDRMGLKFASDLPLVWRILKDEKFPE